MFAIHAFCCVDAAAGSRQLILCLVRWMITTPRLFVRRFTPDDFPAFAALEADPDVKKFSGGPYVVLRDGYARLLDDQSDACLAVCAKGDGRFVGRCGFRLVDDRVELEIFLAPSEQRHGFGGELFEAMTSYCATAFPAARLAATVAPNNVPAIRLLERHRFADSDESVLTKAGLQLLYVQSI